MDGYTENKKYKANDYQNQAVGKMPATSVNPYHPATGGSHTQISFDKEDPMKMKYQQELNRSREIDLRKREITKPKYEASAPQSFALNPNRKFFKANLSTGPENVNQSKIKTLLIIINY